MANEITLSFAMNVAKSGFTASESEQILRDFTTLGAAGGIQIIGTSEENLGAGDIATNGFLFMKNLDTTNFVEWGMSDTGTMKAVGKLIAGDIAFFRVDAGVAVRLKADTASCKVYYRWLNA